MRELEDRTGGIGDEATLGAGAWFSLGTSPLGARLLGAARVAAILHQEAMRERATGMREGVGVEERLMLLEGVGAGVEAPR